MEQTEHAGQSNTLLKSRNVIAALSSIIPGLGHIYKGHYKKGIGLLIISPVFVWAALILGFATAGIGLVVPFLFLFLIGWHAYMIEDRRKHPGGII
jgi:TM2 domain-containing membrane protein YozV